MASWVQDVLTRAPDALADVVRHEQDWIADVPMAAQLVDGVAENSRRLRRWIDPPVTS
ncbi:hypothetical protein [uncultured Jatrophihabitans sp.]|uniref:hypothetical protein n=1 Tax=uncultured Jatrophihabitans sp. TaxID=1610747 RepID=UPI0035CA3DD1